MPAVRIQLSIPDSDLAEIDAAAEALGESRSEYMRKAALDRAGSTSALTDAQERAVRRIFAEMS